jgi:hypothetical protein
MAKQPNSKPNSNNSPNGEDGGNGGRDIDDIMDRLRKGERVEVFSYEEPVEERKEEVKDTLNLRVRMDGNGGVDIMSGGWVLSIRDKVTVFNEETKKRVVYENKCLSVNLQRLLAELLVEYNVPIALKQWIRVELPREDRDVRRLQAWILASINNTFNVLKDNPMNCTFK